MNLTLTWIHIGAITVGIAMLLVLLKIDMGRRARGIFFLICGVSALIAAFAVWMDLGGPTPLLPTAYVIAAVILFGTGAWLVLRPPSAMSAYERQTFRRGARIVVVPVEDQSWSSCCWLTGEPTERRQELLLRKVSLWPLLLAVAGVVAIGSSRVQLVIPLYRASLYGDFPRHQVGGHPHAVQSADMDVECQLVTHGLYCGDPSGYEDPRVAKLKPGARDWSLLLQMDSDVGVMWGDCGMLYFWVRRDEAKQLNFDNAWVILQCY